MADALFEPEGAPAASQPKPIRALTVKQPWAHMIAHCGKTAENRTWPTGYRGLLAIHAGACSGWDPAGERSPEARAAWREWSAALPPPNITGPLRRAAMHIGFGAVIAVAEVAGCHASGPRGCDGSWPGLDGRLRPRCSPWAVNGQHHWQLAGVRPLAEPVPCKGTLGLWRLSEDVEQAVRAQLEVSRG
ncbi:MAG TPA: hypothetical protein VK586_14925 [Streptosporangiaceae bacterium]|nr:hypothetical protein [Streptosporangiaceae bacterium]